MIYFTKYAENKFDILNKHKVYFTREQIEDAVKSPDKNGKKNKYLTALKDGIKVIYQKENEIIKVITFYPVKNV
ncbi:hypothetical protein L6249_02055 [Candidatus Parcubacteria bacterium]|nr:hypothetical protein [Patescibacteria group bacterium]MCG2690831.1 hypothetical protein [Candidatus Parcubacteria bacterium]